MMAIVEWEFELVAGPYGGPAYGPAWDGKAIFFSAFKEALILRYDPKNGTVTEFRRYSPGIRGMAFDAKGNLYGCQSTSRRVVRFNKDGSTSPMEYRLNGKFHNHPHDLTIDSQGRIWFSDPYDTLPTRATQLQGPLDHRSVLRLEQRGDGAWQIRRMTQDTKSPRGILLSRDHRTLYVAESSEEVNGRLELRAYPIREDETLGPYNVLHAFGADHRGPHRGVDGMCLDRDSNIVACAGWNSSGPGPMIFVFSPLGRILETHPLPSDQPTQCTFGDADLSTLYLTTAEGCLYRVRNTVLQGWLLYPPVPQESS